jgi:tetratricopeptide (TPR) repeat protein
MNAPRAEIESSTPPLAPAALALEMRRIRELTRRGRYGEALAALDHLEQQYPRFGRACEERGHCYASLADAPRAIEAFRRAVSLNPALLASWSMLERLHRMTGDLASAAAAAEHVVTLKRLPPQILEAGSLFSEGALTAAESLLRVYERQAGDHIEALRLLARIGHRRNALDDAERLLRAVRERAPTYRAARADYARVLIDRQKYPEARDEIDELLKLEPADRDCLALRAAVDAGLGAHERAIASYRELLASTPGWTELHVTLGHSLKAIGRQAEAIECYRSAAAARADFGDAYWSLANLKTYRFSQNELERMRAAEARPGTQSADRYHLCFALGKALEDRCEYPESWTFYERGNALKHAESRYRPEFVEIDARKQIEFCTVDFFAAHSGVGAPDPDPIFIVGLPRSGSTLLEQILACHSQIEGTQELYEIPRTVLELQGPHPDPLEPRYPAALAALGPEDFRRLGERYLAATRVYRTRKPFFIDKMPNNFRHIGLIHLMMPNAKIIDMRREPMACCFSNFKQLFAAGQAFAYDLGDIGRYYRTYLDLMQRWSEVLPGRVLRVHYEDLVDDLEGSVGRILAFCGLEPEPACLEFYKGERSISTASSEQVRQPIFREGLLQWRHYEPWLGPLRDALGDALTRYRDQPRCGDRRSSSALC